MFGYQSEKSFFQLGASEFLLNRTSNTILAANETQNFQLSSLFNWEYQLESNKAFLYSEKIDMPSIINTDFMFK